MIERLSFIKVNNVLVPRFLTISGGPLRDKTGENLQK